MCGASKRLSMIGACRAYSTKMMDLYIIEICHKSSICVSKTIMQAIP
jgi:hypothetical protein